MVLSSFSYFWTYSLFARRFVPQWPAVFLLSSFNFPFFPSSFSFLLSIAAVFISLHKLKVKKSLSGLRKSPLLSFQVVSCCWKNTDIQLGLVKRRSWSWRFWSGFFATCHLSAAFCSFESRGCTLVQKGCAWLLGWLIKGTPFKKIICPETAGKHLSHYSFKEE